MNTPKNETPPKLHEARGGAYKSPALRPIESAVSPCEPRDLNAEEMRDLEAVLEAEDLEAEAALEAEDDRRS